MIDEKVIRAVSSAPADDGRLAACRPVVFAIAVNSVVGLATFIAMRASGPVLVADEIGYLAVGEHLAPGGPAPQLDFGAVYDPGYGLVLSPWLAVTGQESWQAGVGLNFVWLAVLTWALFEMACDVGMRPRSAAVAAVVAGSAPAVMMQLGRAWPEVMLAALFAVWSSLLLKHALRPRAWTLSAVAAVAGAMYVTHDRTLPIVAVTVAVLCRWLLSPRHRRSALVGLGVLAGIGILRNLLDAVLIDSLYGGADRARSSSFLLDFLRSPETWPTFGRTVVAHLWTQQVGTFGLVTIGVIGVAIAIRRDARWREFAVPFLAAAAGALLLSSIFLYDEPRLDHLVYGRYADLSAPSLILLGLALGWGSARVLSQRAVWAAAAMAVTGVALLLGTGPEDLTGNFNKFTTPTIAGLNLVEGGLGEPWLSVLHLGSITLISLTVVVVFAVIVSASGQPRFGAALMGAAFAAVSIGGAWWSIRPFAGFWERGGVAIAAEIVDAEAPLALDMSAGFDEGMRAVIYRTDFPEIVYVESGDDCPPFELIVRRRSEEPPSYPARPVLGDPVFALDLWAVDCR